MNAAERAAYRRDALERIRRCVLARLSEGKPFPSARAIQRETGLASLATVSRYVHLLADSGAIRLPRSRYAAPAEGANRRLLSVEQRRLRLDNGEDILLSLAIERDLEGRVHARVVGQYKVCGPRPAVHRVLSCTEA